MGAYPGRDYAPVLKPVAVGGNRFVDLGRHDRLDVRDEEKMIPPPAQRRMSKRAGSTVVEEKGSHAIYVSRPNAVAHSSRRPPRASGRAKVWLTD